MGIALNSGGARLFRTLLIKELGREFHGTVSGWFWFVMTPLLLLAVYAFVFGVIFAARAPEGLDVPFVAWLAVALWPWLAFSDGLLRGARAIQHNAPLIAKVALPRRLLAASTQTAAFLLQLAGFFVVLLALGAFGVQPKFHALPYLLLVLASLYVFSLGMALLLAAIQVFLRDLEQLLPTLLMFWFFLTPILYAPELLPDGMQWWLQFNPMFWWMEEIRGALFQGKSSPDMTLVALWVGAVTTLWFGNWIFNRLSPHFQDFL